MPKLRFCALPRGYNLWQSFKTFNLFSLLENETTEIFSEGGQSKSKHKFCRMKVCKVDEVKQYFINPEIENETLG